VANNVIQEAGFQKGLVIELRSRRSWNRHFVKTLWHKVSLLTSVLWWLKFCVYLKRNELVSWVLCQKGCCCKGTTG